jgi:hypothetical protein
MVELSEMEMRIITELIEDWENLPTIANTVTLRTGEESEREEIKDALEKLVVGNLARVAVSPSAGEVPQELSKEESLLVVADLEKHLKFDSSTSYWAGGEDPPPEVSLTNSGFEKAGLVLDERPERWWWPENQR